MFRFHTVRSTFNACLVIAAMLAGLLISVPRADAAAGVDLFVVPAPIEAIGKTTKSGALTLLSMSTNGSAAGSSVIYQGTPRVPAASETGDRFASATAWGDVDGNGVQDLIVGAANEDVGTIRDAGALTVLYNAASGTLRSAALFHQGTPGVAGVNETGDAWGTSVATGDINGDGYDDVIVGAPLEDVGDFIDAGAITVLYGSRTGLTGSGSRLFHQDSPGVPGVNEPGDGFGLSVAVAGSASGSSMYVAVGVPWEDVDGVTDAGALTLFKTGGTGLVPVSPLIYPGARASGVRPAMPNSLGTDDRFSYRLDGNSDGSLVIGNPFADVNGLANAGYVTVYQGLYGAPSASAIYQNISGSIEAQNQFGFSIDTETVRGQRGIAIGAPGDTIDGNAKAGSVTLISGNGQGKSLHQDTAGVPGRAEAQDEFGSYVDLLSSGALFVGAPGEETDSRTDSGAGIVFFGTLFNPGKDGIKLVHQDTTGVPGLGETGDEWGGSLITNMPPPAAKPPAPPSPAPTPTPVPPAPPQGGSAIAPASGTHFGANVSKGDLPTRYDAVVDFEQDVGRQLAIINRFHEFSSGLTSSFFYDREHISDGRTVMISWRATDNAGSTSGEPDPDRAKKITQGLFDTEIRAMARALRDLNAPILLRFNWEMDQDVGNNQNIGTPTEFVDAWRYTHGIFEEVGADNVEWVWAPRAASFNKNVGPTYYPGDAYVDWVGGSAVPINSFRDAQTVYGAWNEWASGRSNPKPQLLWIGLRENPSDGQWKAGFIEELDTLISGPWSGVKAFVYYNSFSPLGFDYRVDTSSRSFNQFKELACNAHFATTDSC